MKLVVIPAGGLGSRFLPVTKHLPKELLPLGDRPLIHHALDEAVRAGFDEAAIVVSPRKEILRKYLDGQGPNFEGRLRLRWVEQAEPRGLGDAVLLAAGLAGAEPFGVLLPDDVIPGDGHWRRLLEVHAATKAPAFCTRKVPIEDAGRYGIAECIGVNGFQKVTAVVEKPRPGEARSNLSILGRYIVTDAVLEGLREAPRSDQELQLTTGFSAALDGPDGVYAVEFSGEIYDSGTPQEYARSIVSYAAR